MTTVDPIKRHLFLEGIFLRYGYDFRGYSEASLDRRLDAVCQRIHEPDLLNVLRQVLDSPDFFRQILESLTITTSEFFRDPLFFKTLRETVLPVLRTYPSLRIWVAGCSTGEEVLSLAILLKEDGLLERSTIYATDINPLALAKARRGVFDLSHSKSVVKNYTLASGLQSPAEYFSSDYGLVKFAPDLLKNVVFSEHNLVTDSAFVEAHLILCRNVLIYFSRQLQDRVLALFSKSLIDRGFLGLGSKESLKFSASHQTFDSIQPRSNIFRLRSGTTSLNASVHGGTF